MNNNVFLQDFMEALFRSMLMNMKYEAELMANQDVTSPLERRDNDTSDCSDSAILNPNCAKEDPASYGSTPNADSGSNVSAITQTGPDFESKLSPTPYDDVYRTLVTDCPALVIPLVNELFNEHYSEDELVTPLQNERFIMVPGSKELKRVTDSYIQISGSRRYHIECQSIQDSSMLIRIFEYDAQIALESSELTGDTLNVKFPESGLIYLRHDDRTPDELKVRVHFQNGDSITYPIKVLKSKAYTIDEIFSKHLYFLIPFHLFTFESEFGKIEADEERLDAFNSHYRSIVTRLDVNEPRMNLRVEVHFEIVSVTLNGKY